MARENLTQQRERAARIEERMVAHYGEGECSLDYETPFTLTIAVILSAQCTDAAVNKVTPELFARYGTPEKMASARLADIEEIIHPLGFYRNKAKNIIAACRAIAQEHGGKVPSTRAELMALPGVGQKTAGVVLLAAFGDDQIPVDTHVFRVSHRIGLADATTPDGVEKQLQAILPREEWSHAHHLLIWHGRRVCHAGNRPECDRCPLTDRCRYFKEH